ncbi:MAG: cobalamin-dependent protein [Deltaproteobacteria bacterium]|nr:cobalamin-dependent protein [Deltaproteobacteria bacterium]
MRICFIYPSYIRHAQANPELKDIVSSGSYLGSPTMSIAILAALTPEHHEVSFYDDRLEALPFDEPFDLVAMPVFTPAAKRAMAIADQFRARGAKVVVGGIFSTLMPDEMAPHVDAICLGEGEPVWSEILYDAERGQLRPRYEAREPYDLSRLPVPRYDLYFAKEGPGGYRSAGKQGELTVDYALQLSRGCPLRCMSCAIPEYMGRSMRFVQPSWFAKNFDAISEGGKKRYISLTEDTSSFPTAKVYGHYIEAMSAVVGAGPSVAYTGASPVQVTKAAPGYFEFLRKLNAISIYMVFGFDRMSMKAFEAKPDAASYQACLDAVKRVFDEGLGVYASLLVGHDAENEGVFDQVLEFAEKAKINTAEFVTLTPYPGTPLWRQLLAEDRLITRDWSLFNDANPTYRPKNYTAERLREGYIYLWKQFYREGGRARHAIQV